MSCPSLSLRDKKAEFIRSFPGRPAAASPRHPPLAHRPPSLRYVLKVNDAKTGDSSCFPRQQNYPISFPSILLHALSIQESNLRWSLVSFMYLFIKGRPTHRRLMDKI
jgi:hypothetical protein